MWAKVRIIESLIHNAGQDLKLDLIKESQHHRYSKRPSLVPPCNANNIHQHSRKSVKYGSFLWQQGSNVM